MTRMNWSEVAPDGAKALFDVHHYVTKKTNLPEELIHLVFLRVSQINGCAHCIDMHRRDLRKTMFVNKITSSRCGTRCLTCSATKNVPLSPGPRR